MNEFYKYLINLAANKIESLTNDENFLQNNRLLSHLIDETVFFEKELNEGFLFSVFCLINFINKKKKMNVQMNFFSL